MNKEKELKRLGEEVKRLRVSKGLTQKDLADKIGKDQQSIQRLETGNVNPSFIFLLEVAKGLDISVTELLSANWQKR